MSTGVLASVPPGARTGMVRVAVGLLVGTVGYVLPYTAAAGVLLPARLAELHPDQKIQLLALLTGENGEPSFRRGAEMQRLVDLAFASDAEGRTLAVAAEPRGMAEAS